MKKHCVGAVDILKPDIMTTKIFRVDSALLLIMFLRSFPCIVGQESGEWQGFDDVEGSGERQGSGNNEAITSPSTTSSTWLAQTQRQAGCGSNNLFATEGRSMSLQLPSPPQDYLPNNECWWTITAAVGYHVQINYATLEMGTCCAFLKLYNAPSQAEVTQPYATIGSTDVSSGSILSDSNHVTMKFTSFFTIQDIAFNLTYTATAAPACPPLSTPSNGKKVCYLGTNKIFYCRFSCDNAFKIFGSEERWCRSDGNWTGNHVTCEEIISCSAPSVPENGKMRCTKGSYVNSKCKFRCKKGYELHGSAFQWCSNNGLWSKQDTSCQGSPPKPTCDVSRVKVCDGRYDCPDSSDERGCICPHTKFRCDCYDSSRLVTYGRFCPSKFECIPRSWQCDGKNDCGDRSDEMDCQCSDTRFQCKEGGCIDRSQVSDGNIDCVTGDDEFICNKTQGNIKCCSMHDDDRCTSSCRCIPNSWIGDTVSDCKNGSDEPCNASKVWCDECWVIINQCSTNQSKNSLLRNTATRCRSLTVPSDRTQKLETNWICTTSPCGKCLDIFHCDNGQFINNVRYCDTIPQCKDSSDENISNFGFRCSGKSEKNVCVLPQKNLHDSTSQCADSSDLCFVNGEFRCFFCLDGKLIVSAKQVCDGIVDCYDISDECLCANQSVCDAIMGEKSANCSSNQIYCHNDTDCIDMDKILCNSSIDCAGRKNQKFCHQDQQYGDVLQCSAVSPEGYISVIAARCDGRPECSRMEDECECEPRPSFCDGQCAAIAVHFSQGNLVCDGYTSFIGARSSPCKLELEKNCSMRFNCKSKDMISIDVRSVCDGILQCDDHSDESVSKCGNKRFYCTQGKMISIDKAFVCNGINDCDNGEDETFKSCGESASLFSDEYDMIANPLLRALFWIMGFFALSGNIFTTVCTAKDMFFSKSDNAVKLANDVFILNLSISDFLMGIYLIAVVVQGLKYSGFYGLVDKEWRSSNLCSVLGTLAVLSSETSAFIMTAMSTFRLVTVHKPFLSSSIKTKSIVIAGCSCWVISFLLAAIPWFPFESGYFIADTWFPNVISKTGIVPKSEMFTLAQRISRSNSNLTSWFIVKKIISDAFKYNPIKGEFGYYGETSVCMPRFYASPGEAAWQYSTFLITINFALFIYMVVAYVSVYKKATGMKQSRSTKKDPNKGTLKRISRLLLTDFFCWMPVCIMGYMSVAGLSLPPNAYIASAGILLPINSAMNPILYSKFIGRQASRAKKWMIRNIFSICSNTADKVDIVGRCDTRAESTELKVIEAQK